MTADRRPRVGEPSGAPFTAVFDLDGTLVDSAPDLSEAANAVLVAYGRKPVPAAILRPCAGQGGRALLARAFAHGGGSVPDSSCGESLYRRFLAHYEANIAVRTRPFPGVAALLGRCRRHGVICALCTNKPEGLTLKLLDALALSGWFAAVVTPETTGAAKPSLAPLLAAIAQAGGHSGFAVMIGDSETDIATAKAAGVASIGVTYGYSERPIATYAPDYLAQGAGDIWPLIAALAFNART